MKNSYEYMAVNNKQIILYVLRPLMSLLSHNIYRLKYKVHIIKSYHYKPRIHLHHNALVRPRHRRRYRTSRPQRHNVRHLERQRDTATTNNTSLIKPLWERKMWWRQCLTSQIRRSMIYIMMYLARAFMIRIYILFKGKRTPKPQNPDNKM
jgi:hypothetical protein